MKFDKIVEQYLQESIRVKYNGKISYYKDLKRTIRHRDEKDPETGLTLPAIIWADGIHKEWWKDGMCHRDEKDPETGLYLPAVVKNDKQNKTFKTFGVFAEWNNPYLTMNKDYESKQLEVLYNFLNI